MPGRRAPATPTFRATATAATTSATTTSTSTYDPVTDRLDGSALIEAKAKQRLCSFNLDLVGLDVTAVRVDGKPAAWSSQRAGADRHAAALAWQAGRFRVKIRYGGVPSAYTAPAFFGLPIGFTVTSDGANAVGQPEGGRVVVPGQRPPARQGLVLVRDQRPGRVRGGRQRQAARRPPARGRDRGLALGGARADGVLPGDDRHRLLGRRPLADRFRDPGLRRGRPRDHRRAARAGRLVARAPRRDPRPARGAVRPLPVQHRRRDRRSRASDPVRARDPDAAGVLGHLLDRRSAPVLRSTRDYVVVHELAHQWFGDDVALERWRDIWLNEGFATYAEWMWLEYEGEATTRQVFEDAYAVYPPDDPLWSVVIGDPGADLVLDNAVYVRGAMTLQVLREEIGDARVLEADSPVDKAPGRRPRDDRGVRRARRAGLGAPARRAL